MVCSPDLRRVWVLWSGISAHLHRTGTVRDVYSGPECHRPVSPFAMMSEIALISTSMILPMESVESAPRPRLPRYGGAALLTLIAAGCLTLSYVHEAWFIRILRISAGLGLPWIVA